MKNTSVLLLGGGGYVASAYKRFFFGQSIPFYSLSRQEVDYTIPGQLAAFLKNSAFDFVINAAGYTGKPNVDACEMHKAECLAGNAVLPGVVREACEENNIPWGHVSSGCIYSGARPDGAGFKEEDTPNFCFRSNNCSFYSGTKGLGEEVLEGAVNCYIWRLRIPFDEFNGPRNYLSKLMQYDTLLNVQNSISHLGEFVQATWESWKKHIPFGIYNVTNPGSITAKEITEIMKETKVCVKDFRFFTDEDEFMQKAAKTPRSNCILDSSKIMGYGIPLTEVNEVVMKTLLNWKN
ncbi:MAG: dTDP-4-dehydrorhamnose reductase [Verrucomicrobia bacterium CG_4_10_14_3_um_filter_43_23]|nr:MAG: dTDP-4-dehydrorhamnose reductase [Verrucomicrobia bacterium CG1_02_43_26]PIP59021.1 MAG: dTDP-4-dehydrorhamnose reductase [Verrucomicrobia bacterium CG22_combo_CG10-13_8_21_14_all_43_17]PIX59118.1 MAG: dTDP-4-dehydrorhamnose reductase [Verrucomicrobia bacterium CG_4_10_14_3_um_filter_43_23]PIY61360.1 MAG: dTDP-4-dehydrorhamnose reductase [Verrucomicrobia bacterium CG_4_10_14_0_8_um_filter_43_34]PJA44142.1 MAG: dTDP-4-dehydrorhamnose reductase [Verrucomicrobia bacterium CG_4_9_14_3_um_fi